MQTLRMTGSRAGSMWGPAATPFHLREGTMNQNSTTDAHTGIPAFAGVVTVPGAFVMPLIMAMVDAAAWCINHSGTLFRR